MLISIPNCESSIKLTKLPDNYILKKGGLTEYGDILLNRFGVYEFVNYYVNRTVNEEGHSNEFLVYTPSDEFIIISLNEGKDPEIEVEMSVW